MPKRYAIFAALCFSISSINIWFLVSGLKEPFMAIFILLFFHFFTQFLAKRKWFYLLLAILASLGSILFRIEVTLFLLIAGIAGIIFRNGISSGKVIASGILFLAFVSVVIFFREPLKITNINRTNAAVYAGNTETASKISLPLVAASGLLGPFPTLIPHVQKKYQDVSVFGPSLILKMMVSFFALIGIFFLLKNGQNQMIPVIAFILAEIVALIIIDSTFKVRYAIPHLPLLYVMGFYGIYYVIQKPFKYQKTLYEISIIYQLGSIGLILLWNMLRL